MFPSALRRFLPVAVIATFLFVSDAFALGPDMYVHKECQFCVQTSDEIAINITLQLGGGPYANGHYVVQQCDNNGFNCHNHDIYIVNNEIVSGNTWEFLFSVFGDGRGQVTQNFALVLDHDFPTFRPCAGQGGWIDRGQSPDYNTTGDVASHYQQDITVVIDPPAPSPTPTPTPTATPSPTETPTPGPTPPQDDDSHKPNDETGGGTGQDDGTDNDTATGGGDDDDCRHGMARYTVDLMTVSLRISDMPLAYAPPVGPRIDFTVSYNQRDTDQSPGQQYSNLGPNWTFNWISYVTDDPVHLTADATVYVLGGGTERHSGFDPTSQTYASDAQSMASLVRTSPSSYEKRFRDGSKQVFGRSNGAGSYPRLIFLTQLVDPAGNTVTIHYDGSNRIDTITDPIGQITRFTYSLPVDPYKITKVTDPFGRFVQLGYTGTQLTSTTDPVGITSQFAYEAGTNFINALTTPYGTVTFSTGEAGTNRWLNMTDANGAVERVEYRDEAPGINAADPTGTVPSGAGFVNADLQYRNTFFWDKKALSLYPPVNGVYDYTKAKITHWLRSSDGLLTSGTAASEKMPLENRVWYVYAGQPDYSRIGATAQPQKVARVLSDGTTQLTQFEYNAAGNVTKVTDPLGRSTTSIYDTNGIDMLEVRQSTGGINELLRKATFNSQHLPLTDIDAAGQTTTFTYNARGQLLTRKNAKNEPTTYVYGGTAPDGYLASVTSPPFNNASAATTYTYDSAKRVRTVTDSDGYAVVTDYDNLDRPTRVTYPDATYKQLTYTDNVTGAMTLDVTSIRDRRGLTTFKHYNSNKQLDRETDPAGRTTLYDWCACGSLNSITDAKNQTTIFRRDLQGRVYQKIFQDGTTIDFLYDGQSAPNTAGATSRLQSSTDAKGQRTNYLYYADGNIQRVSYTNSAGQPLIPRTPTVSYTYDPIYNRVATMTDGIGTTTYAYKPIAVPPTLGAGQVASIDAPLANDTLTFGYDQLGRVTSRSINGAANAETWAFDSLGRVSTDLNKLGLFTNTYVGVTSRLSKVTYPAGASANFTYFPNAQNKRLQQIRNLNDDKHAKKQLISQFDYTYDIEGQVTSWTRNLPDLSIVLRSDFAYDNADQLIAAPLKNASNNALLIPYNYAYDVAGNRTSETVGTTTTLSTPNSVNQIASQSGGANRILTYDLNGNITSDGGTRTFEWDAANRLVAVNYTGQTTRSEFSYDGLGRLAKIVEKTGATTSSTRKFVWSGQQKCEYRDANDAVTLRVYPQGQHNGTTAYFFTRDHLGSVREMFTGGGDVIARYEYDPYGRSTTITGTTPTDLNFTGLYRHAKSNLDLADHRAYDPDLGRWLNRDPAEEGGGQNLYAYAANNPANATDTSGLCPGDFWDLLEQFMYGAEAGAYASLDGAIPFWDPFSDHYNANDPGIRFSQIAGGVAIQTLATAGLGELISGLRAAEATTNVPSTTLARVIAGKGPYSTLGAPGSADVFVTAAEDIAGLTSSQLSQRLAIAEADTFTIIEFQTPSTGLASPILRTNIGFVGRGRTLGGAREFVLPNGPIPAGAVIRVIGR